MLLMIAYMICLLGFLVQAHHDELFLFNRLSTIFYNKRVVFYYRVYLIISWNRKKYRCCLSLCVIISLHSNYQKHRREKSSNIFIAPQHNFEFTYKLRLVKVNLRSLHSNPYFEHQRGFSGNTFPPRAPIRSLACRNW